MDNKELLSLYQSLTGASPKTVEAITGSGSNRQYFRFTSSEGKSVIGVVGTSVEENHAFITLARHFAAKGLPVPRILAVSADERCYLQEDLGSRSLFDALRAAREAGGDYGDAERDLLRRTISELPRIQVLGAQDLDFSVCYPQESMDETNVLFDLNYFKYCFLKPVASRDGLDFHELRLEQDFRSLAHDLLTLRPQPSTLSPQPSTLRPQSFFLYRDFQARNVMLDAAGNPHFIDFQGGRRGPLEYDLVSFLWQASARYPQALREELIGVYVEQMKTLNPAFDEARFRQRIPLFVLFRLLQVLGAYGFRGYFERKQHFLDSIPPALQNLRELLQQDGCCPYPELRKILKKITDPDSPPKDSPPALPMREGAITCQEKKDPSADAFSEHLTPLPKREGQGGESSGGESAGSRSLTVRIFSFSYKRGIPEDSSGNGGGYVFDCRSTHNPGRYEPYKQFNGLEAPVIKFLEDDGEILTFLDSVYRLADHHVERYLQRGFTDLMFSFGCTGGQHRSVYCAQHLAEHLHQKYGIRIDLTHREQNIHTILPAIQ